MTNNFSKHIIAMHGEKGKDWLEHIPRIIIALEKKWSLHVLDPFPLYYNYVAPVKQEDGTDAVVKIGFPQDKEFFSEIEALRIFNGNGSVQLLKEDKENTAILLERIVSGNTLRSVLSDEEAVEIASVIMKKLWKPVGDSNFQTIADWGKGFERMRKKYNGNGPIPKALFEKAEKQFSELLSSMGEQVLLHGDLHHENILLSNRDNFLAIDPKGVIGEREYEVGCFLRNPYPDIIKNPNAVAITQRRLRQFADGLGFGIKRLQQWAFAQAVLSLIWVIEDREEYSDYYISCAEIFDAVAV